jgi:DNA-binding transcriptional LysR family regulator
MHGLKQMKKSDASKHDLTTTAVAAPLAMGTPIRIGLKDWRVLHAVVDCGTFASAASILNMSQPSVSYTLAKLEEQIGIRLFRQEGRKACITPMGSALVDRTRMLVKEAYEVEYFAANLMKTWKHDVRLAVETDFPITWLAKALRTFYADHTNVNIHLSEDSGNVIEQGLEERTIDIAINSRVPEGMKGTLLVEMEMVPVASPTHGLIRLGRELQATDIFQEVCVKTELGKDIVPLQPSPTKPHEKVASTWTVHNFDTAISLVTEGLGYGWLPRHKVATLLSEGKLAVLPLQQQADCNLRFFLIHRNCSVPKIEVKRLATVLREVMDESDAVIGLSQTTDLIKAHGIQQRSARHA